VREFHPIDFEAGSVKVTACFRQTGGGNEGFTFDVYDKAGKTRLLRFDCLGENPHYHYGAADNEKILHIESEGGVAGAVEWSLQQLKTRMSFMMKDIGCPEVAGGIDEAALSDGLARVEKSAHDWLSTPH
jgi:hypothetical protein